MVDIDGEKLASCKKHTQFKATVREPHPIFQHPISDHNS